MYIVHTVDTHAYDIFMEHSPELVLHIKLLLVSLAPSIPNFWCHIFGGGKHSSFAGFFDSCADPRFNGDSLGLRGFHGRKHFAVW